MKTLPFVDNKGRRVRIPAKLTLAEIVKRGGSVKLEKPGTPLSDGWVRSVCPNIRDDARPLGAVASGPWLGKPSENLTKTTNTPNA